MQSTTKRSFVNLSTFCLLFATSTLATEWPQFRGPDRNGISGETGLARTWNEGGPPEIWRRPIGAAFSGIVVAGGALYTTTSDDKGDYVLRLDLGTGETVWQRRIAPQFVESFGNGPRSTPAVDGDRLFALSGDGHLAALNREDGSVLWRHDLRAAFGAELPTWGFASAPLVLGDDLIVDVGAPEAAVIAFDKATGAVRWKAGQGGNAYGSPVVVEAGGKQQLVFLREAGLLALSPRGDLLWEHDWASDGEIKPALPLFIPPDLFFASASYGLGALVVRLRTDGEALSTEEVWQGQVMRSHFNTAVLLDDKVYGFDNATLKCIDPRDGEQLWAQRRGLGKGSLIAADGMLIVLTENGTLKLVKATSRAYEELASHSVLTGRCWTEPTLVNGRLYLRNREEVLALDLRGTSREPVRSNTAATDSPSAVDERNLKLEQILARHAKATGSAELLYTDEGLQVAGTFESFGLGQPFTLTLGWPDRYRFAVESEAGTIVQAYNGKVTWKQDPTEGTLETVKEPDAGLAAEDLATFFTPLLSSLADDVRLELIGRAELDGRTAHHLRAHLPSGRTHDWYLGSDDFLVHRKDVPMVNRYWGDYTRVYWYHRYREHAGLQLPVFIERIDDTFVTLLRIEKAESLETLDEGLFRMPAQPADKSVRGGG